MSNSQFLRQSNRGFDDLCIVAGRMAGKVKSGRGVGCQYAHDNYDYDQFYQRKSVAPPTHATPIQTIFVPVWIAAVYAPVSWLAQWLWRALLQNPGNARIRFEPDQNSVADF